MNSYLITITESHQGQRLDKALAELIEDISRSRIQALIAQGYVMVGGKACLNAKEKVQTGQKITVQVPEAEDATPQAEDIPLDIVYEDDHVIVLNKAAGMVVHPGAGNSNGTLVNALLYHCGESLSGIGGVKRPGIVHRLDKDTTGLMMVAKNDLAHQALSEQLQDRSLKRTYHALCWGRAVPPVGVVDQPIGRDPRDRLKMAVRHHGGKEAVTQYKTIDAFGDDRESDYGLSFIECNLKTGRTHQIRVHMQHLGVPLVGDELYAAPLSKQKAIIHKGFAPDQLNLLKEMLIEFPRQALHACQIEFIHPETEEVMSFSAPYPDDMARLLTHLKS